MSGFDGIRPPDQKKMPPPEHQGPSNGLLAKFRLRPLIATQTVLFELVAQGSPGDVQ